MRFPSIRFFSCISVHCATLTAPSPSSPPSHTSTLTQPILGLVDRLMSVRKTGSLNFKMAEYTCPDCNTSILINSSFGRILASDSSLGKLWEGREAIDGEAQPALLEFLPDPEG